MADVTNKNNLRFYLIASAVVIAIVGFFLWKRKKETSDPPSGSGDTKKLIFTLPTTTNPTVFGPVYWNAFHTLANNIPCSGCQGFATRFMTFFHDTVNLKTGKPLYDVNNFNMFTDMFAQIKSKGNTWVPPSYLMNNNTTH